MPEENPEETGPPGRPEDAAETTLSATDEQRKLAAHSDTDEQRALPAWLVPGLIGLVTITAGLLTWRAGQLGSTAAYEDRQSVGQTITQESQSTEAGLATGIQASGFVKYRAGLATANALVELAGQASEQGADQAVVDLTTQADLAGQSAVSAADGAGVFGSPLWSNQAAELELVEPFDIQQRYKTNLTDISTGITSSGALDPQRWADEAEQTRSHVRTLRWLTLAMLIAVGAFTVAELAPRRKMRLSGFAIGSVVYVATLVLGVPGAWG
ncbi:MAG: hypothetical protein ACK5O2_14080 [Microthrixaceae bacterium]